MLPLSRSGRDRNKAVKADGDSQHNIKSDGNSSLRTFYDRTYKLRAGAFDTKYSCFRAIGPFADFIIGDQLFEYVNSNFELWSYFVEVGETILAGKPRPAPE